MQGGWSRGHDQNPVIQLVVELVVGHVLHVLDGEHPVLARPDVRNGHDSHGALLLSYAPPCQEVLTLLPTVTGGAVLGTAELGIRVTHHVINSFVLRRTSQESITYDDDLITVSPRLGASWGPWT